MLELFVKEIGCPETSTAKPEWTRLIDLFPDGRENYIYQDSYKLR